MTWTNPLDSVPQIPQDYANHYIYGQALFMAVLFATHNVVFAFAILSAVAAGKKIVDYYKEMEPLSMCVGKALVTIAGGLAPYLCLYFHNLITKTF